MSLTGISGRSMRCTIARIAAAPNSEGKSRSTVRSPDWRFDVVERDEADLFGYVDPKMIQRLHQQGRRPIVGTHD
jgi:hypothetical protein